jgi:hypothetical protein
LLRAVDQAMPDYFPMTLLVTLQFQPESNLPVKTISYTFSKLRGLEYDTDFGILND